MKGIEPTLQKVLSSQGGSCLPSPFSECWLPVTGLCGTSHEYTQVPWCAHIAHLYDHTCPTCLQTCSLGLCTPPLETDR